MTYDHHGKVWPYLIASWGAASDRRLIILAIEKRLSTIKTAPMTTLERRQRTDKLRSWLECLCSLRDRSVNARTYREARNLLLS